MKKFHKWLGMQDMSHGWRGFLERVHPFHGLPLPDFNDLYDPFIL